VRRCADGEREAWSAFVARFGALVGSLARRMLQRRLGRAGEADVDEVAAEVFLALLRRDRALLRRYDDRFRVSTYLGVICRTEVNRFLRRAGRQPLPLAPEAAEPAAAGPSPLERLAASEREAALGQLRAALADMPERDRLLLTLRYLEDLDYRTIAAAVGLSADSVGQLLHRAKRRLARAVPALAALWADVE
jgi:RNA polymerase sigma-70 factor (ECF subfamily)